MTSCAEGIAGSGVPLAIIPIGTGNLLARNLGLPVDLAAHILMRRGRTERLILVQFSSLQVQLEHEQPWELHGEVMGAMRRLVVAARPGSLLLRLPRRQ